MTSQPIVLGAGIAPDVSIQDGIVYVAYGTANPHALVLVRLRLDGTEIGRDVLPSGFDQSFPRFSGPWLVYRKDEAHGFAATALHLASGLGWSFGPAGGTFGLTVNAAVGLCAYEWRTGQEPWRIWFGSLLTGQVSPTTQEGAPDGLDSILPLETVALRALTRGDVPGIWYPVTAGNLTVGELRDEPGRPQGGIGVQLEADVLRVALDAQNTPNPRCAAAGGLYALVCWGQTVRLILASEADLRALPPVGRVPGPIVNQPPSKETSVPQAPNRLNELRSIATAHPEINRMADGPFAPNRGGITQLAALQFGFPFGRKSRDGSPTNLSDDALCFRLQDNRFEIYDILSGGDGSVQWDYAGTFADGENGFFVVPASAPSQPGQPPAKPSTQPPAPPVDLAPLLARIAALEAAQQQDRAAIEELRARPVPVQPAPKYRVVGSTSRDFGHSHRINVILEPM